MSCVKSLERMKKRPPAGTISPVVGEVLEAGAGDVDVGAADVVEHRELGPPAACRVTLPVAVPSAEKDPELTTLTLPATLNVTPLVIWFVGFVSVTLPLPVVVMLKCPSPAPIVSAPSGPAGCVTLVFDGGDVEAERAASAQHQRDARIVGDAQADVPALTTSVPILLLAKLMSTVSGTGKVGAASIVSVFAVMAPTPGRILGDRWSNAVSVI